MKKITNLNISNTLDEIIEEKIVEHKRISEIENASFSLTGEVEAHYFSSIRRFFKNKISHNIMDRNQDNIEIKCLKIKM